VFDDGLVEGGVQRVAVGAGQGPVEPAPPVVELAPFGGDVAGSVGQVVADAQEGVQGAGVQALAARQQAEGVVEVRRLAPGQALAVGQGAGQRRAQGFFPPSGRSTSRSTAA
jgi:hypothetical protein